MFSRVAADETWSGGIGRPGPERAPVHTWKRTRPLRRVRTRLQQLAAVTLLSTAALIATPGTASAADTVTPLLNCTITNPDGSFTALLGYDNPTSQAVTIPFGKENRVVSSRFDGFQPTTFKPGRYNGAFSVTVTNTSATWTLGTTPLLIKPSGTSACPPSTELPSDGNGAGPAIALVAAGVIGVAALQRVRRRASAADGGTAATAGGRSADLAH